MTTNVEIRKKFLETGLPQFLIDEYDQVVRGTLDAFSTTDLSAKDEVWNLTKQMIVAADDPLPHLQTHGWRYQ